MSCFQNTLGGQSNYDREFCGQPNQQRLAWGDAFLVLDKEGARPLDEGRCLPVTPATWQDVTPRPVDLSPRYNSPIQETPPSRRKLFVCAHTVSTTERGSDSDWSQQPNIFEQFARDEGAAHADTIEVPCGPPRRLFVNAGDEDFAHDLSHTGSPLSKSRSLAAMCLRARGLASVGNFGLEGAGQGATSSLSPPLIKQEQERRSPPFLQLFTDALPRKLESVTVPMNKRFTPAPAQYSHESIVASIKRGTANLKELCVNEKADRQQEQSHLVFGQLFTNALPPKLETVTVRMPSIESTVKELCVSEKAEHAAKQGSKKTKWNPDSLEWDGQPKKTRADYDVATPDRTLELGAVGASTAKRCARKATCAKPKEKIEPQPKEKIGTKNKNIKADAKAVLRHWFEANIENPYPNKAEQERLAQMTSLTAKQVCYWFINERARKIHKYDGAKLKTKGFNRG